MRQRSSSVVCASWRVVVADRFADRQADEKGGGGGGGGGDTLHHGGLKDLAEER